MAHREDIMTPRTGRNAPCHCGSGKKYKQCHLRLDQAVAKENRAWESAASFLRRDFIAFAKEERFAESFAAGVALFFNNYYSIENTHEMSQPETLRFFDWFTHDHTPDDRPRLIEIYHTDKIELMDEKEASLLNSWLAAGPASAYVLADATGEGKQILHFQDVFDNKEYIIRESGGPGRAEVGDVLIARLLPFRDQLRQSGATGYLPADEADGLKALFLDAWDAFKAEKPDAVWEGFLRQRSYLFAHYELKAAEKAGRPAVARLDPSRPKSQVVDRLARRVLARS
jgi:hypothetical protein